MEDQEVVYARLGRRIRHLRRERGVTQERLAIAAGLNRAYVGYIERAERQPSVWTVARIARALDVDLPECFRFDAVEGDSDLGRAPDGQTGFAGQPTATKI